MSENVEFEGQIMHPELTCTWVRTGQTIAAGHLITPVRLSDSKLADEFAALHLIAKDFEFASFCFQEALKLGVPDDQNDSIRAFISAGTVAYAKPFDTGLRKFKLRSEDFVDLWDSERQSIHSYLHALRQKHIAHSVNDCERSEAVGIVVLDQNYQLQKDGPSGIGATVMSVVGLTKSKLDQATVHIQALIDYTKTRIEELRPKLHDEFRAKVESGARLEMAPLAQLPESTKVGERRN
jgi:hypothetical protein